MSGRGGRKDAYKMTDMPRAPSVHAVVSSLSRRRRAMWSARYRIHGPCFARDGSKALVAIPIGTLVAVSELRGAVIMRWTDDAGVRREQYYPIALWHKHITKHVQPV